MLNERVIKSIDSSVLCWLATSSAAGIPNVSPKEVFTHHDKKVLIVANIASPQTVKNIMENENVCISFIDILVQKGYQLKGKAQVIKQDAKVFADYESELLKITEGKFPFSSITEITVDQTKEIIAPRYILYPDTTEEQQTESAKRTYGFE